MVVLANRAHAPSHSACNAATFNKSTGKTHGLLNNKTIGTKTDSDIIQPMRSKEDHCPTLDFFDMTVLGVIPNAIFRELFEFPQVTRKCSSGRLGTIYRLGAVAFLLPHMKLRALDTNPIALLKSLMPNPYNVIKSRETPITWKSLQKESHLLYTTRQLNRKAA